ncbi:MAG: tRNA uridine-5-carboxymethylaminomethyl(34) synthesis GTPase MnmE [Chlamydiae bacterium]|nr:tRNA uridine-5-carboxymethylaminomethyl(34) synthesis GTPase MnmE [Chlamydiota bacterium]
MSNPLGFLDLNDTIVAIATAAGEGAISIVRLSGKQSQAIAECIFSRSLTNIPSYKLCLGEILDETRKRVDEVLVTIMRAPKSYTGEDVVEIHGHGGKLVTNQILNLCIKKGARLAFPGEFTYRAFINGKIDLTQAEAVQQTISAKNELSLHAAGEQLKGALSQKIATFQKELIELTAIIEAWVDFPEEDLAFTTFEEWLSHLSSIIDSMKVLENTFHHGKIIFDGITLSLVGAPNAGKSSLMNALLRKERAIVTPIPGTTRDILESDLRIGDLHFKLLDTAGIRETEETIELEGIRKSREAMKMADLILLVIDATQQLGEQEIKIFKLCPSHKTILIWNKTDLPHFIPTISNFPHSVKISAKHQTGLDELETLVHTIIWNGSFPAKDELILTNFRHKEALTRAIESAEVAYNGLKNGISPELIAIDLKQALEWLGTIVGMNINEEILSAIFSKFCVGK